MFPEPSRCSPDQEYRTIPTLYKRPAAELHIRRGVQCLFVIEHVEKSSGNEPALGDHIQ
jgi:hypothetical protein